MKVGDLVRWTMPEGVLIGIGIESGRFEGTFWVLTQRGKRRLPIQVLHKAEVINEDR